MARVTHEWYDDLAKRLAKYINEKRADKIIIAKELIREQLKELGFKNIDRLLAIVIECSEKVQTGHRRLYRFNGGPIYYRDILKRITAIYYRDRKSKEKNTKPVEPVETKEDSEVKPLGLPEETINRKYQWTSTSTYWL